MTEDDIENAATPYLIPGASGIALSAALQRIATAPFPMRLVVDKVRVGNSFAFAVRIEKLVEDAPKIRRTREAGQPLQ